MYLRMGCSGAKKILKVLSMTSKENLYKDGLSSGKLLLVC